MRFVQISTSTEKPYSKNNIIFQFQSFKDMSKSVILKLFFIVFPLRLFRSLVPWYPLLIITVRGAFYPPQFANYTQDRLFVDVESREDSKVISNTQVLLSYNIPFHCV